MKLDLIVEQLKKDEGFAPQSFWDNEQWTWGFGTKAPGPGAFISKVDGEKELIARTKVAIEDFYSIFKGVDMSEVRQHAFVNMAYNLGETKLRKFKKMVAAVKALEWGEAAFQAVQSGWYKQVPRRAQRIVLEILEG